MTPQPPPRRCLRLVRPARGGSSAPRPPPCRRRPPRPWPPLPPVGRRRRCALRTLRFPRPRLRSLLLHQCLARFRRQPPRQHLRLFRRPSSCHRPPQPASCAQRPLLLPPPPPPRPLPARNSSSNSSSSPSFRSRPPPRSSAIPCSTSRLWTPACTVLLKRCARHALVRVLCFTRPDPICRSVHNLPQTLTVYQERLQRRSIVHLRDDWIRTVVRIGTKRAPPTPHPRPGPPAPWTAPTP